MPLLKEVPREVEEGKKRERKRIQRKWVRKNWKWILGCAVALILLSVVLRIVSFIHNHQTYVTLKKCLSEMEISEDMTELIVPGNRCNEEDITVLDFSRFTGLKMMMVGDGCFGNVRELKLTGLGELESVVIGKSSFSLSSGVFTLQRCDSLTELTIGHSSFGGYHEIVLDGVPVLVTISMGDGCFAYSSLELKGENGCVVS